MDQMFVTNITLLIPTSKMEQVKQIMSQRGFLYDEHSEGQEYTSISFVASIDHLVSSSGIKEIEDIFNT